MDASIDFSGILRGSIADGGGGGGGDEVIITPVVTSGTKIADISVNGVNKDLYAPNPTQVIVNQEQQSGTKIASIEVNGQSVDLYAPSPTTPTEIIVTPVQQSGTKIATIGVNGVNTDLYAPNSGGGVNYSTNEQRVGTWIDGKPLYRKTLNIISTSNDYYYSCSDLSIDQLVNINGYTEDNNKVYAIPINCYERNDFNNKVYYQNTNHSIYIGCIGYYPNYVNWVITIEYTKTTDSIE